LFLEYYYPHNTCLFEDDGEELLEAADIPSEGVRCDGNGEVVHVPEHDSLRDCHVYWGDIDEDVMGVVIF